MFDWAKIGRIDVVKTWLLCLICCFTSSGCFSMRAPELAQMRYEIEDALPGSEFEKDTEISIGPVMMTLIRAGARISPGSEEWRPFLSGARRVQVAVYHARSLPDQDHRYMDLRLRSTRTGINKAGLNSVTTRENRILVACSLTPGMLCAIFS